MFPSGCEVNLADSTDQVPGSETTSVGRPSSVATEPRSVVLAVKPKLVACIFSTSGLLPAVTPAEMLYISRDRTRIGFLHVTHIGPGIARGEYQLFDARQSVESDDVVTR